MSALKEEMLVKFKEGLFFFLFFFFFVAEEIHLSAKVPSLFL
jgi:hypothetical protein